MITILGPTASGKTSLAAALAARIDAEIISADSRQVYRGMTIGTGKDLDDYRQGDRVIPYHLIDICEPGTKYNLFQYQQDFHLIYNNIVARGVRPILCGGTGLYIESVLKGYALSPVPQNQALRDELADKSLAELTEMLEDLKHRNHSVMHNRGHRHPKPQALISSRGIFCFNSLQNGNGVAYDSATVFCVLDSDILSAFQNVVNQP